MHNIPSTSSLLQQASIDIEIEAPIANTRLTQNFVNQTTDIIEAVYSFPVPRQAVVIQVIVTINDEKFTGQIKPITQAETSYEQGIEDGKRSVLIRDLGDGQHELRAGNLAPEDCLVIEIQIAQLMQAQPGGYRYFLPTVMAPKYGRARGMDDVSHQYSLLAHYPFSAHLRVVDSAEVNCASHSLIKQDKSYEFAGALDEDIVLTITSQQHEPYVISALQGDYPCALGVLPPKMSIETSAAVSIVLLIDCSGSMSGLSMQQTRTGLSALLNSLQDGSEVTLMCFGCDVIRVNPKPLIIDSDTREVLLQYVGNISADMGGTELWKALGAAQRQAKKHNMTPEIILLTDGQVQDNRAFFNKIHAAQSEPCRVNTIGVGSAVSDNIVIQIAQKTKGQWMLVHPNEPMGERVSHFIAQVSAPRHACLWKTSNTAWSELLSSTSKVHGGLAYVVYEQEVKALAPISPNIALNNEVLPQTQLTGHMAEVLEKLVGQQYLHSLNESEATDLSLKLGLVNRYTSFVMVSEQSVANADGLPKLEVVPQMTSRLVSKGLARMGRGIQSKAFLSDNASYDIPSFLRREASVQDDPNVQMDLSPKLFLRETSTDMPPENAMLTKVERRLSRILLKGKIPTLTLLLRWGLNQDLAEAIQEYFIQHQISDTVCYIATVLLWLNKSKGILSGASMDILQKKIDEASSQDVLSTDALIQVLEEIGEYTA
jgi:uncharacterized protein YegL